MARGTGVTATINALAERQRRYVSYGQRDDLGLQTVIARIEAGDAQWVRATIERVVEILTPRHEGIRIDEIRAIAFGYLARPAELLTLLREHTEEESDEGVASARSAESSVPCAPAAPRIWTSAAHLNRALAFPADLLDTLRSAGLAKLAPRAVLYVHLRQAALLSKDGVTRVEGLGAHSLAQLRRLLSGRDVVVKPVIDLAQRVRSTAYEHPESLKERVHLLRFIVDWNSTRHITADQARTIIDAADELEVYPG